MKRREMAGGSGMASLAGLMGLVSTVPATAAEACNPDAALIGWCTTYNAHRTAIEAAYHAAPDDDWTEADAAAERIEGKSAPFLNLICTTPATTPEGARAVARSLLRSMAEVDPLRGDNRRAPDEYRLQVALLRGLLAGGAA